MNLAQAGDIPLNAPTVSNLTLPFPELSQQEVHDAVFRAGNIVSGSYEIPTTILRHAYPKIANQVYSLFNNYISLGHHLCCFRQMRLLILQKPNKCDLPSSFSYRLIILPSALGKGLEHLLAKRKAWIAGSPILTILLILYIPRLFIMGYTSCRFGTLTIELSQRLDIRFKKIVLL